MGKCVTYYDKYRKPVVGVVGTQPWSVVNTVEVQLESVVNAVEPQPKP